MNALRTAPNAPVSALARPASILLALPLRRTHRERDFGIGYGTSSGYARARRYAADWAPPRFRCV